jgi:hypothetical protein
MKEELSNLLNSLANDLIEIGKYLKDLIDYIDKLEKNQKPQTTEDVLDIMKRVCQEEGVPFNLAYWVAWAESQLDPYAINVNRNYSLDRGLFQWNSKWHPEVSNRQAFDVEEATRLFCRAVKQGHLNWWDASRPLWEPHVKDDLKSLGYPA